MEQPNPELTLHMPLNEVNVILQALANMPWAQVNALIGVIHNQVRNQLEPMPEPDPDMAPPME